MLKLMNVKKWPIKIKMYSLLHAPNKKFRHETWYVNTVGLDERIIINSELKTHFIDQQQQIKKDLQLTELGIFGLIKPIIDKLVW